MLNENITALRKINNMTQEALAEKLGITRQTLSKWETGESSPDMEKAVALAGLFGVSLDDLASYSEKENHIPIPPKGKYMFGTVKVGEKGQIVIPAKARKIFDINPGDSLIILGDIAQGIAILPEKTFMQFVENIHTPPVD